MTMAAAYELVYYPGSTRRITESTLIEWANVLLKPTGEMATNFKSFSIGILFIHLLRLVCAIKIEPKKDRSTIPRKTVYKKNIKSFLTEMRSRMLLKESVDEDLVLDGDFETTKKLLTTLLLYRIQDGLNQFFAYIEMSPKNRLLKWIGEKVKYDLDIKDFEGSWEKGIALGALVENFLPGSCSDWKTWSPINAETNAAKAMSLAAEWLDVQQIITPKDMVNHFTDEESRMAYLSQFLFARVKPGFEHIYEPMNWRIPRLSDLPADPVEVQKDKPASPKPIIPPKPNIISDIYDWSSDIWSQIDIRFKNELEHVFIPKESVLIGEKIGQGEYGEVLEARLKDKHKGFQMTAVKKLTGVHNAKKSAVVNFLKEAAMLQNMKHENVVPLIGFLIIDSQPHIIQPLMKSNLLDHLRQKANQLDANDLYGYLHDAAKGLAYIAHNRIVHRDIAARNCLITENLLVKIGDFGMARDIFQTGYYSMSAPEETRIAFRWMASEAVNKNKFTLASDVFSFGVLMYEVLTKGGKPYGETPLFTLVTLVNAGNRPHLKIPTDYSIEIQELFSKCLSEIPKDRPTMNEVSVSLAKYETYCRVHEDLYEDVSHIKLEEPLSKSPDKSLDDSTTEK